MIVNLTLVDNLTQVLDYFAASLLYCYSESRDKAYFDGLVSSACLGRT